VEICFGRRKLRLSSGEAVPSDLKILQGVTCVRKAGFAAVDSAPAVLDSLRHSELGQRHVDLGLKVGRIDLYG